MKNVLIANDLLDIVDGATKIADIKEVNEYKKFIKDDATKDGIGCDGLATRADGDHEIQKMKFKMLKMLKKIFSRWKRKIRSS